MSGIGGFVSAAARERYFDCYDAAMAESRMPREQVDVDTTFGQVRVYRHGPDHGAPIVLLHGRAATSAMWAPNVCMLASENPVYTVDTLGEPGRSVQTAPITSGADCAAWLDQVLAKLDLTGVHMAGVSAGGWLTFNQAVHAPDRLASITLLDPAQVLAHFSVKFLLAGLASAPFMPQSLRERFLSWVSGGPPMDTPIARLLTAGLRDYRIRLPMPTYASDEVLAGVRLPVLALLGGRSVVHDPAVACDRAIRLLPDCAAEVWPNASHAISGEEATAVNTRFLSFVKQHTTV